MFRFSNFSIDIPKKKVKETINFYLEKKKQEEGFLKEAIKNCLDNKEWVSLRVGMMCSIIMQIKVRELQLQSKLVESVDYMSNVSNWKKVEREVRTKFNVPRTVPIRFK